MRFPIDRGLIGWRLLLVRADAAAGFARIDGSAALAGYAGIQGHDWPDVAILRSNGLRIETSTSYERLFQTLARGEVDYFPRALGEAGPELARHPGLGLGVAPGIVLHYPSALYFFVRKDNAALAGALRDGLEALQRDGRLQALFEAHFGAAIEQAGFATRRVIRLRNPDLPVGVPQDRRELWFEPQAPE